MTELPHPWQAHLQAQRQASIQSQLYRQRRLPEPGGRDFASNDYLGLAKDPAVANVLADSASRWGGGAGSAQLLGGYHAVHQQLETALAAWVNRPAALLFSTGYMANLGLISALAQRGDQVIEDKLNHASLIDAAKLSDARLLRFRHNDIDSARRQMALPGGRRLLAVESVFSMDGDVAPLQSLASAAAEFNALLCIDEAHALGVVGPAGAGASAAAGLGCDQAPVIVGTFGKSLGTFGAFVAGPQLIIDALVNHARSQIYTTASPPALAAATLHNLHRVQTEQWRRDHLEDLIDYFRRRGMQLGLPLGESQTPIQPVLLGTAARAVAVSQALADQGFHVPAIRPPTVPANSARLRVSLNTNHKIPHIEQLLVAIAEVLDDA